MAVLDAQCVQDFIQCAHNGWLQGWHERNGGNLSYRMKAEEAAELQGAFDESGEWTPLGVTAENLANEYFLVTGTNRYFQNIKQKPAENIGICKLNADGSAYKVVWGLTVGHKPTSEFATHVMNHSVRVKATNGTSRVISHAHPTDVIALTFILENSAKAWSQALWQAMTECVVIFPQGVGVIEWMVCGGPDIARASAQEMEKYAALIWAQHGLFCAGDDFDSTFGMMHAIVKAAEILIKVFSSGKPVLQSIEPEGLRDIAKAFNLPLDESLLEDWDSLALPLLPF
ncbi:MAG: rhamnulose-1-phosphate aldolase [Oscillospiraceae bacterium]|jgi:rhamnulose-1-phosphate aldolase|nr:rhamnulose-1-phosphate aldolase [Oscillospiraceae bacterium]